MKAFSVFLFFASMLISGALVFGLSGCSRQEQKETPPTASQPKTEVAQPLPVKKDGPVSVDFDNVSLSEVAVFVTSQTGKGFILNGAGDKALSWIEYNIPREKLFDSFAATLAAAGLVLKPTSEEHTAFTIDKAEEIKVPCKLNFATSERGTFFLLGSTIYTKESFPFPVTTDGAHWYATVPKSMADTLLAPAGK